MGQGSVATQQFDVFICRALRCFMVQNPVLIRISWLGDFSTMWVGIIKQTAPVTDGALISVGKLLSLLFYPDS